MPSRKQHPTSKSKTYQHIQNMLDTKAADYKKFQEDTIITAPDYMEYYPSQVSAKHHSGLIGFNKSLRMAARLLLSLCAYSLIAGHPGKACVLSSLASLIMSFGKVLDSSRNLLWGGLAIVAISVSIWAKYDPSFAHQINTSFHPSLIGVLLCCLLSSIRDISCLGQAALRART
jgi:hypothetical protein